MLKRILFIPLFWFSLNACAQNTNKELFIQLAKDLNGLQDISERTIALAQRFLGTPYVASTLEGNAQEQLVVNLSEVDCTTFVEQVLAIAFSHNYQDFKEKLQQIRYRQGEITDYTSRLHYFSDWIYENKQAGRIRDIDTSFQQCYFKEINFMSSHASSYPALTNNTALISKMKKIETEISARPQYFIPKSEIEAHEYAFKNGDIVAITTNIAGLDVVHTGFIIFKNERAHLLHASSEKKMVVISEEPLADYLARFKSRTGIILVRKSAECGVRSGCATNN